MINAVIEKIQSMEVLKPNLCKNTMIVVKYKNREDSRDKSKIEKSVQEICIELRAFQTRQDSPNETHN